MDYLNTSNYLNTSKPVAGSVTSPGVTVALYVIEMLLYLSAIVCCLLFLILLIRILVFHQNLRLLLGNMAIAAIIQGVTREMWLFQIIFAADGLDSTNNLTYCWIVMQTYYATLYIVSLSLLGLAIERMIATVYAKTYEATHSVMLGVGLVALQWLFAWGVILINKIRSEMRGRNVRICNDQSYMADAVLLISLYTVLFASLAAVTTFVVLLYLNKRRYTVTFLNRSIHSLSERYQLSENIKTTRSLYPVVTTNAICSLLGIGLMIFSTVFDSTSSSSIKIAVEVSGHMFWLLLACYATIFPWLTAFGHPELQREVKKVTGCCSHGKVAPAQPRNANGVALILTQSNERSAHFEALNNAWNV